jgi:hypothetical protein
MPSRLTGSRDLRRAHTGSSAVIDRIAAYSVSHALRCSGTSRTARPRSFPRVLLRQVADPFKHGKFQPNPTKSGVIHYLR